MNEMMSAGTPATGEKRKVVYTVTEKGEKNFYTKLGVAFTNKDGSISVRLDAVPVNGTLYIREEDVPSRRVGGAT